MSILFHKPKDVPFPPEAYSHLQKYKLGKALVRSGTLWAEIDLQFAGYKITDHPEDEVIGILTYVTSKMPLRKIGDQGLFFFHEGIYDRFNDGDDFLNLLSLNLSFDGFSKIIDICMGVKDASIAVLNGEVKLSAFKWINNNGVFFSNENFKPAYTAPYVNHHSSNVSRQPSLQEKIINGTLFSVGEMSPGMKKYFGNSPAHVFVFDSWNHKFMPMDIISRLDGVVNPTPEFVAGVLASKRPVTIEVKRYYNMDPTNNGSLISIYNTTL